MNINLWKEIVGFTELKNYPLLPCPHCLENKLAFDETSLQKRAISEQILEQNSRKFKAEKAAKKVKRKEQYDELNQQEGFWLKLLAFGGTVVESLLDPLNGKHYQFCGFFSCQGCQQSVTASGFYLQPNELNTQSVDASPVIKVEHFSPTIPMIPVSIHVPESIKLELFDAFKHFHFDPLSSASKLRRVIEQFCDEMQATGSNLHRKICSLKEKHPEEVEYLEPLKLIGNEGTHAHNVSEVDLLHAFQMVQFVLDIYDRKARYKATQENYEQLVNKFGEDKIQLRLPQLITDSVIVDIK